MTNKYFFMTKYIDFCPNYRQAFDGTAPSVFLTWAFGFDISPSYSTTLAGARRDEVQRRRLTGEASSVYRSKKDSSRGEEGGGCPRC